MFNLSSAELLPSGQKFSFKNTLLRQFAERWLATGMPKMAVIGAVMRKLVHLIYGVVRSGKPFDAH